MLHSTTESAGFSWAQLEAPRYTSYPSAHHFAPTIKGEIYGQWLYGLAPQIPLSVYVHIPFCRELCWFCGCHTKMTRRYEPIAQYVRTLLQEIALLKPRLGSKKRLVNIHFGGGSPSLLRPNDLISLLYALTDAFGAHPQGEMAIELDPRTTTPEKIEFYAKLGFNRVSIGIQDFDPKVQQAVNRIQSYELVASVMKKLRQEGIDRINCDLIYGLPHQTQESFQATLAQLVTLDPPRIALFSYAHVPHVKKHQRLIDVSTLPADREKLELYKLAREELEKHGYVTIGIDHFAKPNDELAIATRQRRLKRNFQGYTADDSKAVIGIGSSAISQFPQGYAQNSANGLQYRTMIEAGQLPIIRGWSFNEEDTVRKEIIDALMCSMEVDLAAIVHQYRLPEDHFAPELAELAKPEYDDIVLLESGQIKVITPYRMAARAVALAFDRYRSVAAGRYSKVA